MARIAISWSVAWWIWREFRCYVVKNWHWRSPKSWDHFLVSKLLFLNILIWYFSANLEIVIGWNFKFLIRRHPRNKNETTSLTSSINKRNVHNKLWGAKISSSRFKMRFMNFHWKYLKKVWARENIMCYFRSKNISVWWEIFRKIPNKMPCNAVKILKSETCNYPMRKKMPSQNVGQ